METHHSRFREHLPTRRTTSCSAAGSDVQRTQKSIRSPKRRRWGALHVCIAWKIYHHKQLKRIQQKSNSRRVEATAERQSEHRCSGQATAGGRRSDLNPPSPRQLKGKNLRWRDKCGGRQTVEDLPVGDKCSDGGVMSDLGSPGRKEPNRPGGFSKSRKMLFTSMPLDTPVPHVYAAELPLLCPSIRASLVPGPTGGFVPFPRASTRPSWESEWSIYKSSGQHFEEYPGHRCGLSAAPQGHKQEFYPFCTLPPPFPHMMEMAYGLRRREGPKCHTHQPPPPGFLVASYPGP